MKALEKSEVLSQIHDWNRHQLFGLENLDQNNLDFYFLNQLILLINYQIQNRLFRAVLKRNTGNYGDEVNFLVALFCSFPYFYSYPIKFTINKNTNAFVNIKYLVINRIF